MVHHQHHAADAAGQAAPHAALNDERLGGQAEALNDFQETSAFELCPASDEERKKIARARLAAWKFEIAPKVQATEAAIRQAFGERIHLTEGS
jgi:hypothetical protein